MSQREALERLMRASLMRGGHYIECIHGGKGHDPDDKSCSPLCIKLRAALATPSAQPGVEMDECGLPVEAVRVGQPGAPDELLDAIECAGCGLPLTLHIDNGGRVLACDRVAFRATEDRSGIEVVETDQPGACPTCGGGDGVSLIAAERKRQVEREGWTADHDDNHGGGEMARCAALYALPADCRDLHQNGVPVGWPFDCCDWKPGDRIRELSKAGALIAAEIDRLQREKEYIRLDHETAERRRAEREGAR